MKDCRKKWVTLLAVIFVCGAGVTGVSYFRGTATLAKQRVTIDGRIFDLSLKRFRHNDAIYAEVWERVSLGQNGKHSVLLVKDDQADLEGRESQILLDETRRQYVFKCRQEAVCSFDPVTLSFFPSSSD